MAAPPLHLRRGLAWMLGASAALVAMNSCAKVLREDGFSTAEIIFYRTAPGLVWIWLDVRRRQQSLRPVRADLVALRSGLGIAAMAANFFAVRALTLVQHQALHLLQPVFVALFAPLILRERMHQLVLLALVLAASGAFFVLAPLGDLSALPLSPALVGVGAAVSSALAHVTIRKTSETEAPEVVVFHFALHAALAGLVWGLAHGDFSLGHLTSDNLALLGSTALFGTLGQLWMTRAYGLAPASSVAMVAYAGIPLSLGVDIVFWDAHAPASALAGAALLVAAGSLLTRRPAPAAQPGQP
ncbi:DMT family transporter [Nannocystis sp. SCPEA4]|uniref:DMT family transporter n=1 Tax=Nannocystis sp. SCPEA4 TaxID=2996787 RepID=UPI002271D754|nr:DMT family transporter [Nannocystis sp. SCPEA4]MCY1056977.1 DMT family transporter [Nannocystis sp. SCPEA4]